LHFQGVVRLGVFDEHPFCDKLAFNFCHGQHIRNLFDLPIVREDYTLLIVSLHAPPVRIPNGSRLSCDLMPRGMHRAKHQTTRARLDETTDPAPLRRRRDQLDLRPSLSGSRKYPRVLRRGKNRRAQCGGGTAVGLIAMSQGKSHAFLIRHAGGNRHPGLVGSLSENLDSGLRRNDDIGS